MWYSTQYLDTVYIPECALYACIHVYLFCPHTAHFGVYLRNIIRCMTHTTSIWRINDVRMTVGADGKNDLFPSCPFIEKINKKQKTPRIFLFIVFSKKMYSIIHFYTTTIFFCFYNKSLPYRHFTFIRRVRSSHQQYTVQYRAHSTPRRYV